MNLAQFSHSNVKYLSNCYQRIKAFLDRDYYNAKINALVNTDHYTKLRNDRTKSLEDKITFTFH